MGMTRKLKVLIAEDNPVDTKLLEGMLKDITTTVEKADIVKSVEDALAVLSKKAHDVLILDLNLLDSGGIETVRHVSAIMPNLPIVVNTGDSDEKSGLEAVQAGAEDFLVKGKYTGYILQKTLYYAVERKRMEVELKEAYQKLKTTQEQLIDAEKMKLAGSLATGVAHEVKNPLATIMYGVTYLQDHVKSDNENYVTVVDNIKEAALRADSIIMDLLDFSAMDNFKKASNSVNDVIDRVIKLISFQFDKKFIKISKDYQDDIKDIFIDEKRIHQVILNLLLNAQHAIKKNGQVTIKTFETTLADLEASTGTLNVINAKPDKPLVVVQFIDNGCGISEDKLRHIFDPFYTTRRSKGGVGLGLSVVKTIMDHHKADIIFQNNKEQGVTVTLIFKQSEES